MGRTLLYLRNRQRQIKREKTINESFFKHIYIPFFSRNQFYKFSVIISFKGGIIVVLNDCDGRRQDVLVEEIGLGRLVELKIKKRNKTKEKKRKRETTRTFRTVEKYAGRQGYLEDRNLVEPRSSGPSRHLPASKKQPPVGHASYHGRKIVRRTDHMLSFSRKQERAVVYLYVFI